MSEDFGGRRRRIRVAGQRHRPPRPAGGEAPIPPGADGISAAEPAAAEPMVEGAVPATTLVDESAATAASGPAADPGVAADAGAGVGTGVSADVWGPAEDGEGAEFARAGPFGEPAPANGAPAPAETGGRRPLGRVLLPLGLAAAVIALAVVAVIVTLRAHDASAAESARTPALAAAESAASALLSVDYRHLDSDVQRANTFLAPGFRQKYDSFRQSLASTYTNAQTVIVAEVTAGGVRDVTADHAVGLVFVDQLTTGTNRGSGRLDRDRVRLTMVRVGGHWLVSAIDAI